MTCGLGTEAHKSCNCIFDTVSFLFEFCHYALNVHVVLSLSLISAPVQAIDGITSLPAHKGLFADHGGEALRYAGYLGAVL